MLITSVTGEKNKFAEGKRIPEIAGILNLSNVEAAFKLLVEEELEVGYAKFGMCEEDVKTVMAHPVVMIGSDSSCSAIDGPLSVSYTHLLRQRALTSRLSGQDGSVFRHSPFLHSMYTIKSIYHLRFLSFQ